MGRFFSVLVLLAVLLCPADGMRSACAQPVFFSMLFPQLIPGWMPDDGVQEVRL